MLMNADDLALMRQEVPVDRGRNRVGIGGQPHRAPCLKRSEEGGKPVGHRGQEGPDVVHNVSGPGGIFNDPPEDKSNSQPPEDCLKTHVASRRRPDSSYLVREPMLARTEIWPMLTG